MYSATKAKKSKLRKLPFASSVLYFWREKKSTEANYLSTGHTTFSSPQAYFYNKNAPFHYFFVIVEKALITFKDYLKRGTKF